MKQMSPQCKARLGSPLRVGLSLRSRPGTR